MATEQEWDQLRAEREIALKLQKMFDNMMEQVVAVAREYAKQRAIDCPGEPDHRDAACIVLIEEIGQALTPDRL